MSKRDPRIEAVCKVLRINPDTVKEVEFHWTVIPELECLEGGGREKPSSVTICVYRDGGVSYHSVKGRQFQRLKRAVLRAEKIVKERERHKRMAEHMHDMVREAVILLEEAGKSYAEALGLDERAAIKVAGAAARVKTALADLYACIMQLGEE
ncbi:MAG TPA: hypothetical protein VIK75_09985 [Calditerricola sp.]